MGKATATDGLPVDDILAMFHSERGPARRAYARFVSDCIGEDDRYEAVKRAGSSVAKHSWDVFSIISIIRH